ncbi:MAG: hypothetical protein KZQ76_00775 [Candidatus Thiodiazotropha sp. (ex Epidulcina cf. delphinae)]|nr:hypothetical protein [Candidatus Thiodiazotropha sp. (ex Epidulcina cf. delphinae)]
MGYLIDFGGGVGAGEGDRDAAIREFVEETEAMYFSDGVRQASRRVERVKHQIPIIETLLRDTGGPPGLVA